MIIFIFVFWFIDLGFIVLVMVGVIKVGLIFDCFVIGLMLFFFFVLCNGRLILFVVVVVGGGIGGSLCRGGVVLMLGVFIDLFVRRVLVFFGLELDIFLIVVYFGVFCFFLK